MLCASVICATCFERMGHRLMLSLESIHRIRGILECGSTNIPGKPGVYAFWWMGERSELLSANRHIGLRGPGGRRVDVKFGDWWEPGLPYPCLYVGKSTDIRHRFSQHLLRTKTNRLHASGENNQKAKPYNSSCQLRFGIEHIFPNAKNPVEIITNSVGFSFDINFSDNAIAERFFAEDRLVGFLRPWFNIDSER